LVPYDIDAGARAGIEGKLPALFYLIVTASAWPVARSFREGSVRLGQV
jgi:hypothetical protein